jgi:hypothetical protein
MKFCSPKYNNLLQRWERLGKGLVQESEARKVTIEQRLRKVDGMLPPLKEVTDCQVKDLTDGVARLQDQVSGFQQQAEQALES